MRNFFTEIIVPIGFFTVLVGGAVFTIYTSEHPKTQAAEAAPPAPPAFSVTPEETLPEPSSSYVRTRVITDTATKREYIIVYTSSGTAITPRLPAEAK